MEQHYLTNEQIAAFASSLVRAERTPATIEKYLRSVRAFFLYLDGQPVTKDAVVAWKEHLQSVGGYSLPPSTHLWLPSMIYLLFSVGQIAALIT